MMVSLRNRKRVLIFLLVPILALIPLLTENIIIEIISALLLIIYVGFIIFLRDSVKTAAFSDIDEIEPVSAYR
jgi:TRAP-type uncharacterized transport system fused permease subunit